MGRMPATGHRVRRLLTDLVRLSTALRSLKEHITMEAIVFSLTHHWSFFQAKTWSDTTLNVPPTWRPHECQQQSSPGKVRHLWLVMSLILKENI
jgi:hypothetical protein